MPRSLLIVVVVILALAAGTFALTRASDDDVLGSSVAVSEAMSGDTTGYARADAVPDFQFPRDHGPHPGFKTEWWYFTGNLDSKDDRPVGYELTIFRIAAAPPEVPGARVQPAALAADSSAWRTDQFYMAHFALTDVQGETMRSFERFSRAAAGLAGAQAEPFRVWLEDWEISSTGADFFPLRLKTSTDDGYGVDLTLRAAKPKVLQGDRGLSQKGPGDGNASYYYSYTRLVTEGQVMLPQDTLRASGLSWMDREWSTSALGDEQVGWDWFALQLGDGRDLMYYQLRSTDGSPSRFSEGVLVGPDGQKTAITREDVELEVTDQWQSPRGGTYPNGWRLRVPEQDLSLTITPYLADQEMQTSVRYWEGAVRVEGTASGAPVAGRGYVEMTGYAEGRGKGEEGRGPLP